jgi:hypothetical protein
VIGMTVFQFHSAQNPGGFVAYGSDEDADAYRAALNRSRTKDFWTVRKFAGKKPRGINLSKALAAHDAAHKGH